MNDYNLNLMIEGHEVDSNKIGALVMRLNTDLEKWKLTLENPTSGQILNIQIRKDTIIQMSNYIENTDQLVDVLLKIIQHLQNNNESNHLKGRIRYLENRLKKAEMVLTQGFNYNLSLLEFQRSNDFI